MLKKILTSPWTALTTLVLIVLLRVADPVFVESVRLKYFDTLTTSKEALEEIEDKEFHKLRKAYIKASENIQQYVKDQIEKLQNGDGE